MGAVGTTVHTTFQSLGQLGANHRLVELASTVPVK